MRQWWPYYAMMAPGIIFFVLFHYLPIWEAKIAFEQVRIIPPNIWVGLKHFQCCSPRRCSGRFWSTR
ncbi:hypothetical protein N8D56_17715 [Devosia sp. A8/3-2]|nr:hypothetical protein N8D56_17715 [Devosia sp. A8/3-2]